MAAVFVNRAFVFLAALGVVAAVAPLRTPAAIAVSDASAVVAAGARPNFLRASRGEVNHSSVAPSVMASVAVDRARLEGGASANATNTPFLRKCQVGEQVQAWYEGDGHYYDATVKQTSPSGQVTVVWYNHDPWHRTMDGSKLVPPCTTLDAPVTQSAPPPPAPVTPVPPVETQAPPSAAPAGGAVYFLFMLKDHLPHADLWATFFENAPPTAWRALVHCQDEQACRDSGLLNMRNFELIATTPTYYCHDLVTAMSHLLVGALMHRPAYTGAPEKYVFLSDSTLPVKPFAEIHGHLLADNDSDFCLFPRGQWAYGNVDGRVAMLPKHHQWVVLSRPHAELFVREWKPVDAAGVWNVWLKDGSWAGQERAVPPQTFYHPPYSNTCADEWAFVATIFGALELGAAGTAGAGKALPGFGGGAISLDGAAAYTTQGRCRTFSFWDAADGPAFASLGGAVAQDPASHITCYPKCPAHPASFDRLSEASLSAMRHSSFLFVRKFSPWAKIEGFEKIFLR